MYSTLPLLSAFVTEMADDTYLSVFSQPPSEAGDSMTICCQVAFGAANGPCTQSQTLLKEKRNVSNVNNLEQIINFNIMVI